MFHSRVSLVRKPVLRKATDTCIQNLIYNVFSRNVRIHSSSWCGHILLHSKHVHRDGQVTSLKDGLVFLDLHYRRRCVRFISLYMPHAGYSGEDLRNVYDMLHFVLGEAGRLHYKIIVGKNFNTELHVGHRGNFPDEFACMWRLQAANCENHDN